MSKTISSAPAELLTPIALEALRLQALDPARHYEPAEGAAVLCDASCLASTARHPSAWDHAAALMSLAAWMAQPVPEPAIGELSADEQAVIRAMRAARR